LATALKILLQVVRYSWEVWFCLRHSVESGQVWQQKKVFNRQGSW